MSGPHNGPNLFGKIDVREQQNDLITVKRMRPTATTIAAVTTSPLDSHPTNHDRRRRTLMQPLVT